MNQKLKILMLVMAVLGFVSVISDSAPSLQQTLGIIIAIFILHFYLQKNFDDLQAGGSESIQRLQQIYKRGQRTAITQQPQLEEETVPVYQCSSNRPDLMPAYVRNEQADPFRLTTLQSYPLKDWEVRNAQQPPQTHPATCRIDDYLLFDQRVQDQVLFRDPAKSAYAQQKMLRNKGFFARHFDNELRRAENRVWYEDAYLC